MKPKCFVIINEQHSMLPDQERVLTQHTDGWDIKFVKVPAAGWNLEEIRGIVRKLRKEGIEFVACSTTTNGLRKKYQTEKVA